MLLDQPGRYQRLLQQVEEKVEGGIAHRDTSGIADGAVAAVPDRPVLFDFSHVGVAAVAHGAVALNFADIGVAAVTHLSITADFPDQAVAAVADIAIAFNFADVGVAAVPNGAVALDFANRRVAAVAYRLRIAVLSHSCRHKEQQRHGEQFK